MNYPTATIRVHVSPQNPGQFFACCGLVELANRVWDDDAVCWFHESEFLISTSGSLSELLDALTNVELLQVDADNDTSSPIEVNLARRPLRLDWWQDELAGGRDLKVWAGTMESVRIARAMQGALRDEQFRKSDLFNVGVVAYDPENPEKKVEPYYFDARRAPNAHSRDVGFSPNDLQLTTTAFPAVELLCLVGLQRCRPMRTDQSRIFDYYTWSTPLAPPLLPTAVGGMLPHVGQKGFRFENWYRTGQKKHKAFRSAIPLTT